MGGQLFLRFMIYQEVQLLLLISVSIEMREVKNVMVLGGNGNKILLLKMIIQILEIGGLVIILILHLLILQVQLTQTKIGKLILMTNYILLLLLFLEDVIHQGTIRQVI